MYYKSAMNDHYCSASFLAERQESSGVIIGVPPYRKKMGVDIDSGRKDLDLIELGAAYRRIG